MAHNQLSHSNHTIIKFMPQKFVTRQKADKNEWLKIKPPREIEMQLTIKTPAAWFLTIFLRKEIEMQQNGLDLSRPSVRQSAVNSITESPENENEWDICNQRAKSHRKATANRRQWANVTPLYKPASQKHFTDYSKMLFRCACLIKWL